MNESLQICTVCGRIGYVGRCCGRYTHRDVTEAELRRHNAHLDSRGFPSTCECGAEFDPRIAFCTPDTAGNIGWCSCGNCQRDLFVEPS